MYRPMAIPAWRLGVKTFVKVPPGQVNQCHERKFLPEMLTVCPRIPSW